MLYRMHLKKIKYTCIQIIDQITFVFTGGIPSPTKGAYTGEAESEIYLPPDFSTGKVEFGLSYDTGDRKKIYMRGIRFYNRHEKLLEEIAGEEEEDETKTLQLLKNEKICGARVAVYAYLPCEISFIMVTQEPMADYQEEEDSDDRHNPWAKMESKKS
jgi:hypothetical protein